MYDWANSVYSLTITTAVFPIYFQGVTTAANGNTNVDFFIWNLPNSSLYAYSLSASFFVIAALLPLLTGIADANGSKKAFMRFFTYLGSIACIGLFFFTGDNLEYGIVCAFLASIGYSGGLVFYDAYLPEIVTEDRFDVVSARGYSFGYIGSVILLVLNLAMIMMPDLFFINSEDPAEASAIASRISFLTVGIWWICFAEYSFYYLPSNVHNIQAEGSALQRGYAEIQKVLVSLKDLPILKKFLAAFFFYNMGVQTVMYMATIFANDVLNLPTESLIITVLVIQVVAIFGATLFARLSQKKGNKFALSFMIFIWIGICLYAYTVNSEFQFYALAFVVGIVMGGIQALSRATYSKLIPENTIDNASYFSFYDVAFNLSIVFGTMAYGAIYQIVDDERISVLAIGLFFMVGLGFLILVKMPRKPLSGHH